MWGSIPALLCPTRDLSLPSLPSLQAGRVVLTAGQIGLQPATMMLAPPTHQASLSLSHVCSVMEANHTSLHCTLCGLCYYTSEEAGWSARATWRKVRGTQGKWSLYVNPAPSSLSLPLPPSPILQFISQWDPFQPPLLFLRVPALPRGACVEWSFTSLTTDCKLSCV